MIQYRQTVGEGERKAEFFSRHDMKSCRPGETETETEERWEDEMAKQGEKRRWIVGTHLGPEPTWATSAKKAISNVRYRIYGAYSDGTESKYWTARVAS